MSYALQIGLSALQANQQALQTVSSNIANASTPGYHRQVIVLSDRQPTQSGNVLLGAGVDATRVARIRSSLIEQSLTTNTSAQGENSSKLDTLQRLEALFGLNDGSIQSRLQSYFDKMFAVTSGPDNNVLRQQAVSAAQDLAEEINSVGNSMHQLQQSLDNEIDTAVRTVNELSDQITSLNRQIGIAEGRGLEPHDLRDQRDQLINQLADLVDVRTWEWAGQPDVAVFASGGATLTTEPAAISVKRENGTVSIWSDNSGAQLTISGGKLAGLLESRNEIVPAALEQLQSLTNAFIGQVDQIQATGLGHDGPMTWLDGIRGVKDVNAPLGTAGTQFPVVAGKLYVSVTDRASGARRMTAIDIDPATDSLASVAAKIDAVDHLQTYVDPQTGTMSIGVDAGYGFDFVGRLETTPDVSSFTGSSPISISGRYTGQENDKYQFTVVGTGDVGVTPGLQVEVRNEAGALIRTLDVGQGYEPGSALDIIEGVKVAFGPGTVNNSDTFSTDAVANSDTAGFLPAAGLRTFFDHTVVGTLSVAAGLRSDPGQLSVSYLGLPGDGTNAARFAALRDKLVLDGGKQTFEEHLAETTAQLGGDVQNATNTQQQLDSVGNLLQSDRESVSGVDPNEEFVRMLNYQRGFQSAAKLISTVNTTLDELFNIIR